MVEQKTLLLDFREGRNGLAEKFSRFCIKNQFLNTFGHFEHPVIERFIPQIRCFLMPQSDCWRLRLLRSVCRNSDPNIFAHLPLEPSCIGGWGSQIPYMQTRIDYLSSLLSIVSGLKYLKQKQRIEHDIEMWRAQIRSEEVRELLESWYR